MPRGRPTRAGQRGIISSASRFTASELQTVEDLAAEADCCVSDLIRMALSEFAVRRGTTVDLALTADYHRTGFS